MSSLLKPSQSVILRDATDPYVAFSNNSALHPSHMQNNYKLSANLALSSDPPNPIVYLQPERAVSRFHLSFQVKSIIVNAHLACPWFANKEMIPVLLVPRIENLQPIITINFGCVCNPCPFIWKFLAIK